MCCDATDDAAAQRGLPVLHVDPAQLEAEVADLMSERERAVLEKNKVEEQYLQQIIAVRQEFTNRWPLLTAVLGCCTVCAMRVDRHVVTGVFPVRILN